MSLHFACDLLNPVISDNKPLLYVNVQKLGSKEARISSWRNERVQICNLFTCLQGRIILFFFFFFPVESPLHIKSDFMLLFHLYLIHWPTGQITEKSL